MIIRTGTCSWKYDSWRGLVYSNERGINYLKEYSQHFNSVEIDQWFWSLHSMTSVSLPKEKDVIDYTASVPADFRFTIKVPNSITLTHHYKKAGDKELIPNAHFLSVDLYNSFLETIAPMTKLTGVLIFQFEYLNKQKMPGQDAFMSAFGEFASKLKKDFKVGVEIRNPNYLNDKYFGFLSEIKAVPVFLQGYYMPPVFPHLDAALKYKFDTIVVRLHGPNRSEIEEKTGGVWDRITDPKNEELVKLVAFIKNNINRKLDLYINVNNHYEGSAPLTIGRINDLMEGKEIQ
ncbi:MAG: DUF72 domain-containing protein [Ignavibacteriaceae bacterium]|nr:DUF72 domain-containing protein [Ignavibacteriaceae bacterium]